MARNWDLDSEELPSSILADFPIGREEELAATSRRYESEKSEFLAIYLFCINRLWPPGPGWDRF